MTNNESGRSMVEMLGVLAIIGVLSIGGIAGYTQAMKKYRINEAVNTITMAAVMCGTEQKTAAEALDNDFISITSCTPATGTVAFVKGSRLSDSDLGEVRTALGTGNDNSYTAIAS